jgi:hypothetical protein
MQSQRIQKPRKIILLHYVFKPHQSLQDYQRSHHVVFLVFKDVAVPNIFIAASPRAGGDGEWHRGKLELHDNRCHFLRIHPDSVFPTRFIRVRWPGRSSVCGRAVVVRNFERLPGDDLDIY